MEYGITRGSLMKLAYSMVAPINLELGLHMTPSLLVSGCLGRHDKEVLAYRLDENGDIVHIPELYSDRVDGKEPMNLMALAIPSRGIIGIDFFGSEDNAREIESNIRKILSVGS